MNRVSQLASAMDICITQQQANLLLPLLKQISERGSSGLQGLGTPISTPSSSGSSQFVSPVASKDGDLESDYGADLSDSSCRYSCDELFQPKKKNSKSSSAHSYCHVCASN